MALRTTVVGSWWWPQEHAHELRRHHDGELGERESVELLNTCATAAIAEQRELGLDEWTGGEFFTDNFIDQMRRKLTGIEVDEATRGEEVFDYDDLGVGRIVGEVDAPDGLGYVEAYRREAELPGGVSKATAVSPLEVTIHEAQDAERLREQMPNLVRIVNRELRGLADAGCPHVQLDAPVVGILINMGQMTTEQGAAMLAPCFDGVQARKGLHVCNGNLKGRPFSGVLRNATWVDLLQRLEGVVDVANLESSYFSEWSEREAFTGLPAGMELAAGIVDEANYWVEPVSRSARARPTGPAWSAGSACGSRRRAASAAIRAATARSCARRWRTWWRRRARSEGDASAEARRGRYGI